MDNLKKTDKNTIQLPIQYVPCRLINQDIETKNGNQVATVQDIDTIKVYASDETPIARFSYDNWEEYYLIFSHNKDHINLNRIKNNTLLFFDGHPFFGMSDRIGKVKDYEIKDNHLELSIKLGNNPKALSFKQDLKDNVEPGVSIGAQVTELEVIQKAEYDKKGNKIVPLIMKAVKWELIEISAVDVPANPLAGVLKDDIKGTNQLLVTCNLLGDTGMNIKDSSNKEKSDDKDKVVEETKKSQPVELSTEQLRIFEELQIKVVYLELRAIAIEHFKHNRMSEDQYDDLGFSEEISTDTDRLTKLDSVDSKVELKLIERSIKNAILRHAGRNTEKDKTFLNNSSIQKPIGDVKSTNNQTPDGELNIDEYSQKLVKKLQN